MLGRVTLRAVALVLAVGLAAPAGLLILRFARATPGGGVASGRARRAREALFALAPLALLAALIVLAAAE